MGALSFQGLVELPREPDVDALAFPGTGFRNAVPGQAPDREAAYLFYRNAGGADQWGRAAKFTATDGSWDDEFGGAVAVSGSIVIVGACQVDGAGTDRGAAYLFAIP